MKARDRIVNLRERGYSVHVMHLRPIKTEDESFDRFCTYRDLRDRGLDGSKWDPCGGITEVEIYDPVGKSFIGVAVCSERDNFRKNMGLSIALGRAMSAMAHGNIMPVGPEAPDSPLLRYLEAKRQAA